MARTSTGAVVEHVGRDGRTYRSLRFTAYGKRQFVSLGVVSAQDAARALRHTLADVERGTWQPAQAVNAPPQPDPMPTFHQFAEQWWLRRRGRLRPNTQVDYRWRLMHLLPFFGEKRLDEITVDLVEQYIAAKLAEPEPLSPRSINMGLTLMYSILEGAVDRELISRNPAKGRERRVREHKPQRTYLDTAEQIAALLDAAGELDREARRDRQHVERRAILATLTFAGLRIGELCALRWRDVDLASGWLHVEDAKTDAGKRKVKLRGALLDELKAVRSRHPAALGAFVFATGPGGAPSPNNVRKRVLVPAVERANENLANAFVFATGPGGASSPNNVRKRVLVPAVERANENLATHDRVPLPALTPHSLRRTFASVLYALGEPPTVVMAEMGHTQPGLALRIYAQALRLEQDEKDRLRALVEGGEVAVIGRRGDQSEVDTLSTTIPERAETAR